MRFSPAFLDEIRDRVPISSVIGARVSWDRRKSNPGRGDWWACCPFHGEKTPSFHCEDRKGRYHCFGCGVTGDHFRFLTEQGGMSFPEAVEEVARLAGVAMPARDPEAERRDRQRASLHDVMEMAVAFFQERLQAADGAKARAYLRDRGLTPMTQQGFRLGYAPDSRNALKEHLAAKGVEKSQIEACGLVVFGEDIPVSYDRFRDRIMFPIEDARGRVIAFGGRALAKDAPAKYLNSPETELFHKGETLYNLARARKAKEKDGTLIAVEGYMDVIALAQAGIGNAVAPLGTALTESQLDLLWRVAPEPVLCFDGDQAGLRAAFRAADLALPSIQPGRSLRFALLPDGQDPDDLVRAGGPEAFRAVLAAARPLADMVWMRETAAGVFDTPERRAELEKALRETTARIRDESVRRHYGQAMRERIEAFFGSAGPARRQGRDDRNQPRRSTARTAAREREAVSEALMRSALVKSSGGMLPVRESGLLVAVVNHPGLLERHFDDIETLEIANPDLKRLRDAILDAAAHQEAGSAEALRRFLAANGFSEIWERAVAIVRRARLWPALEEAALDDAVEAFAQALHLHRGARALHRELRAAEAALADDPTDENYRHLIEVQAQFRNGDATEALIEGFGIQSGRGGRG